MNPLLDNLLQCLYSAEGKGGPSWPLVVLLWPLILDFLPTKRNCNNNTAMNWFDCGSSQRMCWMASRKRNPKTTCSLAVTYSYHLTQHRRNGCVLTLAGMRRFTSKARQVRRSVPSNLPWGYLSFLYSYLWGATFLYWYQPKNQNRSPLKRQSDHSKGTGWRPGIPGIRGPRPSTTTATETVRRLVHHRSF